MIASAVAGLFLLLSGYHYGQMPCTPVVCCTADTAVLQEHVEEIPVYEENRLETALNVSYEFARLVMAEAEGEPFEGKLMVARVVMNRVRSSEFPDDVLSVIYEPGQFTCLLDGRFWQVEPSEECFLAVEMVAEGWDDGSGVLYFSAESGGWHDNHLRFVKQVGRHKFYKENENENCFK